jgi:TetR/AcrR family transcriptional regulator
VWTSAVSARWVPISAVVTVRGLGVGLEPVSSASRAASKRVEATLPTPETTLEDLIAAYLQSSLAEQRMTPLLLWAGLTDHAEAHGPAPRGASEREDLSDLRRRQAEGEIAADLDPGLLELALMRATLAPIAIPHVVRRITGRESDDPEFQTRYVEQLCRIVRHLAEHNHSR